MKLETHRLIIVPLTPAHLNLYLQADGRLEAELGLPYTPRTVPQALVEAMQETILPLVADPTKNYVYATLWTIISKAATQMVADLCFKGEPNADGEIEVGYGTYEQFQGQGYMTEALQAVANWAFTQPKVKAITAETDESNIASHRTLEKNGFTRYAMRGEMIWWRLEKGD
jgi:[ribosomal protein S5]-alanine N-acetyltransferase